MNAYKTYSGQGWVTYDTHYCRRAANTKSLDWHVMDFTLYNETFAGRAKVIPRCHLGMTLAHPAKVHVIIAPVSFTPQQNVFRLQSRTTPNTHQLRN